eukprot:1429196-Pyramimonas_sp.AAC.1
MNRAASQHVRGMLESGDAGAETLAMFAGVEGVHVAMAKRPPLGNASAGCVALCSALIPLSTLWGLSNYESHYVVHTLGSVALCVALHRPHSGVCRITCRITSSTLW